MNKILIVEASISDGRLMSGLLTRAGYEPIAVDKMEQHKKRWQSCHRRCRGRGDEIHRRHGS